MWGGVDGNLCGEERWTNQHDDKKLPRSRVRRAQEPAITKATTTIMETNMLLKIAGKLSPSGSTPNEFESCEDISIQFNCGSATNL